MPTTGRELLERLRARSSHRPQHRAPRRPSRVVVAGVVLLAVLASVAAVLIPGVARAATVAPATRPVGWTSHTVPGATLVVEVDGDESPWG